MRRWEALSVNTLVACDSSFMIHSLKEFHIPGIDYTFSINTTHVAMLLVSIFIIIMAVIARVKINSMVKPDDTPGMFQNALVEIIVEMLNYGLLRNYGKECKQVRQLYFNIIPIYYNFQYIWSFRTLATNS